MNKYFKLVYILQHTCLDTFQYPTPYLLKHFTFGIAVNSIYVLRFSCQMPDIFVHV